METNFIFVVEENDEVVGIANGRLLSESGLARLGWTGVHLTHQRNSMGKGLLAKVI